MIKKEKIARYKQTNKRYKKKLEQWKILFSMSITKKI